MSKSYVTEEQLQAAIAKSFTTLLPGLLAEFGIEVTEKKGKKAKLANPVTDGAYRDARLARRADPARPGGAGMTKAEKSELYRKLNRKLGRRPSEAEWNKACAKVRGI